MFNTGDRRYIYRCVVVGQGVVSLVPRPRVPPRPFLLVRRGGLGTRLGGSQQSVVQVLNCALRPSSSFAMFMSVQLLREVPRSSEFRSPFRELCSTAKVVVST